MRKLSHLRLCDKEFNDIGFGIATVCAADLDGDGVGDACDADWDGDGVVDAIDACVPTPIGSVVDANGCAIAQLCPCTHPNGGDRWKNHGGYVSCVARAAGNFVLAGLIFEAEKGVIVSDAGESDCGAKK